MQYFYDFLYPGDIVKVQLKRQHLMDLNKFPKKYKAFVDFLMLHNTLKTCFKVTQVAGTFPSTQSLRLDVETPNVHGRWIPSCFFELVWANPNV